MAVSIISQPADPILAKMPELFEIRVPDAVTRIRSRVLFRIVGTPTGDYESAQIATGGGLFRETFFEMNRAFDALLPPPLPTFGGGVQVSPVLQTFHLDLVDTFFFVGTPIEDQGEKFETTSITVRALKGGYGPRKNQANFRAEYLAGGKFLEFARESALHETTHRWLTAYLDTTGGSSEFTVSVTIYYTDNTTSVFVAESYSGSGLDDKTCFLVPAGFGQLDIADNAALGKVVSGWAVQLKDGDTALTENLAFILTPKKPRRTLLFLNSAGGLSTMQCFANIERTFSRTANKAEITLPYDHPNDARGYQDVDVRTTGSERTGTAYLFQPADKAVAKEFLRAQYFWLVGKTNYWPVTVGNAGFVESRSLPNATALQFTYAPATDQYVFDDNYDEA